ncbi:MAG: hypothetical protein C5B49_02315 [Bdellovibrio sp.]|nr:MAG: hypothetical protein C5B49_02315 [Bdellovibrio sp.]
MRKNFFIFKLNCLCWLICRLNLVKNLISSSFIKDKIYFLRGVTVRKFNNGLCKAALSIFLAISLSLSQTVLAVEEMVDVRSNQGPVIIHSPLHTRRSGTCQEVHSKRKPRLDDTAGTILPRHDIDELRAALQQLKQSSEESGEDLVSGRLSIKDLAMFSRASKDFMEEVRQLLVEMKLDKHISIKGHFIPTKPGVKGASEKFVSFFPMPQDYQTPIPEELWAGVPGVLSAEVTTGLYSWYHFPRHIYLPLIPSHFFLLFLVTAFRRTLSNWTNRGVTGADPATATKVLKQVLVSSVFIGNFEVMTNWPQIYEAILHNPLSQYFSQFAQALGHFFVHDGPNAIIQTAFFALTFSMGVFKYEKMLADNKEKSEESRRAASLITPAIFWVSGPMLLWATITKSVAVDLWLFSLNPGQVGLLALTAAGSVIAYNPMILDPVAGLLERRFYGPVTAALARIKERFRKRRPDNTSETNNTSDTNDFKDVRNIENTADTAETAETAGTAETADSVDTEPAPAGP